MTEHIETLALHLRKLSAEDQAIIVNVINRESLKYHNIHRGMLCHVPLHHVCHLLAERSKWASEVGHRRAAAILSKLGWPSHSSIPHSRFYIYLDSKKVLKRFGKHPELGKVIPGALPIKRARDRKMFERKADAFENYPPRMTLKLTSHRPHGNGNWQMWECAVIDKYVAQAHSWLVEFCR